MDGKKRKARQTFECVRSQALSVEVGALATLMISVELSESTSRAALDVDHDGGMCRRR